MLSVTPNPVPSSSGLGRLVLIQKIAGSTPAGITRIKNRPLGLIFYSDFGGRRTRRVRPDDEASKNCKLVCSFSSEEERKAFAKQKPTPATVLDFLRRRPTDCFRVSDVGNWKNTTSGALVAG